MKKTLLILFLALPFTAFAQNTALALSFRMSGTDTIKTATTTSLPIRRFDMMTKYDVVTGFYPSSNPNGYISSVPAQSFASLTGKPSTLFGYGINDAYPLSGNPSGFITSSALSPYALSSSMTTALSGKMNNPSGGTNQYLDGTGALQLFPAIPTLLSQLTNDVPYATTSALTSGLSGKFNNPTGTTLQYLRGDGTVATFPTIPSVPVQSVFGRTGNVIAANGDYNTDQITEGSTNKYDKVVSLTGANGLSVTGTYPGFTLTQYLPSIYTPTRTANSNFTVSTTKQSEVKYSVSLSVTNPLLAGSSTASAFLEYSLNAGSTWTTVAEATNISSVALAVAVAITNVSTQQLTGYIPANALARIRTTTAGTGSVTLTNRQQEIY